MRVVHRLSYASTLEARQHSLLPAWQWPTWLMVTTWLLVHIYSFIRYCQYGDTAWQHVTLYVSKHVTPCHMMYPVPSENSSPMCSTAGSTASMAICQIQHFVGLDWWTH